MSYVVDKVALLKLICENPGWQPPAAALGSTLERHLDELGREGWIVTRLDGWEATPRALERFPNFTLGQEGEVLGELTIRPVERAPVISQDEPPVAVASIDGIGYEVRLGSDGRFHTTRLEQGGRREAFGHYDSIRLLARIADVLGL